MVFVREGIINFHASRLKLVSKFYDVHVHAETGRSVHAGIGEMLGMNSGIGVRKWIDANPQGRDDLNRASEVLYAELMIAEESWPHSSIEDDKSLPAA